MPKSIIQVTGRDDVTLKNPKKYSWNRGMATFIDIELVVIYRVFKNSVFGTMKLYLTIIGFSLKIGQEA